MFFLIFRRINLLYKKYCNYFEKILCLIVYDVFIYIFIVLIYIGFN